MTSLDRPSRLRWKRHRSSDLPPTTSFPVESTVNLPAPPNQPSKRRAIASAPTVSLRAARKEEPGHGVRREDEGQLIEVPGRELLDEGL